VPFFFLSFSFPTLLLWHQVFFSCLPFFLHPDGGEAIQSAAVADLLEDYRIRVVYIFIYIIYTELYLKRYNTHTHTHTHRVKIYIFILFMLPAICITQALRYNKMPVDCKESINIICNIVYYKNNDIIKLILYF